MSDEAQTGEGERVKAKVGMESWKLKAAKIPLLGKTTFSFEHELHDPVELFKKDFPPYFGEVELELSPELSITEVKLKGEPEGKTEEEKKMGVLNLIWDKIIKDGLIQAALGINSDTVGLLCGQWTFGDSMDSEGWTPEIKKSTNALGSFEVNVHDSWKFPDAKPVPVEMQIALVVVAYDGEKKEWAKHPEIQGEGTVTALELPAIIEGDGWTAEGAKLEGKITLKGELVVKEIVKKVWTTAKSVGNKIAEKVPQGARAALTWADENLTLVVTEDGELVATGALDVILTVAVVVLVVVSLAAIIYIIKLESDLDGLEAQRKRLVDQLSGLYMQALRGEPMTYVAKADWENASYHAGQQRRKDLIADHGDGFDSWLADNQSDVQAEVSKQFRIVVSDALWAGWAKDCILAKNQWLGWNVTYGPGSEPKSLNKMDLFLKYAKDSHHQVDGYLTGEWSKHNVQNAFLDQDI